MNKILEQIAAERARQDAKWGQQDWPSIASSLEREMNLNIRSRYYGMIAETEAKISCDEAFDAGAGTYAHIAVEEMAEVICADDDIHRREELVQLAAVCVAWIESIDRRIAGELAALEPQHG